LNVRGVRRFHRWTAAVAALGLVVLTLTGAGLLHPEWFGRAEDGPVIIAADPATPGRLLRAAPFLLEESRDGGATWNELPFRSAPAEPVALAFAARDSGLVWLLGTGELAVSRDGGAIWETLDLPPAVGFDEPTRDLALPTSTTPLVTTAHHAWRYESDSWRLLWFRTPSRGDELRAWLHRLHTGHWGPGWMTRAHDAVAGITVLVIISGLVLFGRRNGRNGRSA
jgi:hypothetical protein